MPYCSGCGSRYQEGDTVCKSCGFELVYDVDPKSAEKHPAGTGREKKPAGGEGKTVRPRRGKKPDSIEQPALSRPDRGVKRDGAAPDQTAAPVPAPHSESRCLQAEVISNPAAYNDIHLGKGIIKPKWIEVGLDGFHFKYEEPPVGVRKMEPVVKEASSGYQTSGPGSALVSALGPPAACESDGGIERGAEQNGFPDANVPAVWAETGDCPKGPAEPGSDARSVVAESRRGEPSSQAEVSVPAAVDRGENDGVIIRTPEDPAISLGPETAPGGSAAEPALESSSPESDRFFGLRDGPGDIPPAVNDGETEAELVHWPPDNDAAGGDGAAEVVPESGAGIESANPAPRETDLPEEPKDPNKVLWRGQQSWFGIPFPCFYQLTSSALMIMDSNGKTTEFEVSAIGRVTLRQSWFAKVLGIGDLILEFHNSARLQQVLTGIPNPGKVKSILDGLIASGV